MKVGDKCTKLKILPVAERLLEKLRGKVDDVRCDMSYEMYKKLEGKASITAATQGMKHKSSLFATL